MDFLLDPQVGDGLNYQLITHVRLKWERRQVQAMARTLTGSSPDLADGLGVIFEVKAVAQSCEGADWLWARASSHFSYSAFMDVPGFMTEGFSCARWRIHS